MNRILSVLCAAVMISAASAAPAAADASDTSGSYISGSYLYDGSTNKIIGVIDEYPKNANADGAEWVYDKETNKSVAVIYEHFPEETYSEGDWIYDKKTGKIVDYSGHGGDIVIPENTVMSRFVRILSGRIRANSCDNENVDNITVGRNVTFEGTFFKSCNNVHKITFNNSADQVPESNMSFGHLHLLTDITLPEGTKKLGDRMFKECYYLENINNIENVTSIGDEAFEYCASITDFKFPDKLESIGNDAFSGCVKLTSAVFPPSLHSIGERAFLQCESLSSVVIPDTVTALGENAFKDCKSLKSITFGDSIDYSSLPNIPGIEEINYTGKKDTAKLLQYFDKTEWAKNYLSKIADKDGFAVVDGELVKYTGNGKTPVIPGTVKKIGTEAFYGSDITELTVSEGVTEIADRAFSNCKSLKEIKLPDSLKTIGKSAFGSCTTLNRITIPASVEEIGAWAFANCSSLSEVTIEGSPYINENPFANAPLRKDDIKIGKELRYEGIEKNTRYDSYDPLMYFYPDYNESWENDFMFLPTRPPEKSSSSSTASAQESSKPAKNTSPAASPAPKPAVTPQPMSAAVSDKQAIVFNDVPSDNETLTKALSYLYEKGVVKGYSGDQGNIFLPDNSITRAEIAKMLDVASGNTSNDSKMYSDVSESHWAYSYIKRSKFFEGYEDGTFKPEGHISVGEAVTSIIRFAGLEEQARNTELGYPQSYIAAAIENGIAKDGDIREEAEASRGEVAVMLYNAMTR